MNRIAILTVSTILASCFKSPVATQATLEKKSQSHARHLLSGVLEENGVTAVSIDPNSKDIQQISVPSGSTVAGSSLMLPPGALAIATKIFIEEATPLATSTSLSELSISSRVLQQGTAVSIQASEFVDAKTPMTVAIPLPVGFGLGLAATDFSKVVVFYRVTRNDQASNVSGVISNSQIIFENGFAKVQTLYFGAFQVAVMSEVLEAKEVKVETPAFTKSTVEAKPKLAITSASEIVAQKGKTITINGINFRQNMILALGQSKISNLMIQSDVKASFVAPDGDQGGRMALSAEQDGVLSSIPIFYLPSAEDLPIITMLAADVCAGIKYFDRTGAVQVGLKNCSADISGLTAGDLRSGVQVGTLTGTLPVTPLCAADGQTNCVTTSSYPALQISLLTASVLKKGTVINGVTGAYPNATYPLAGSTATADLDAATFYAKIKSPTAFEYFDSAGNLQTGNGDSDITGVNIKSGIDIFGTTGTFGPNCTADGQTACLTSGSFKSVDTLAITGWDIRAGKTVGGISGNLSFYKNMAQLTSFNRTIGTAASFSSTVADLFDTIDDFNKNLTMPSDIPTGIGAAPGFNWARDSISDTGIGGGTASNGVCDGTEECVYNDQTTGLYWMKSDLNLRSFEMAITYCDQLIYGSYSDWRLPMQKELLNAYINGIWGQKTTLSLTTGDFWSSSTATWTGTMAEAWVVRLAGGYSYDSPKGNTHPVICIR